MKLRRFKRGNAREQRHMLLPNSWSSNVPQGAFMLAGSYRPDYNTEFAGLVESVGRKHGLVAAAVFARSLLISQLRFLWRRYDDRSMFHSAKLDRLNRPAMGIPRPQFFASLEKNVCYGGTAYIYDSPTGFRSLRPDWVQTIMASGKDASVVEANRLPIDAQVIGYVYHDGGVDRDDNPTTIYPENMGVWAPDVDPVFPWRGQSWITALLRDVALDEQAEDHVDKFFENAATPNVVYSMSEKIPPDAMKLFTEQFRAGHEGAENAWKSVIVGGGADVTVIGSKIADLGLQDLRGGIETHIATASRVPAVLLGIREGMQGSSLMAGNYSAQRRQWADGWLSPVSQSLAVTLDRLLGGAPRGNGPGRGAELWTDMRDVLLLQEDAKDAAEIQSAQVSMIRVSIDAGFEPDAAVEMALAGDVRPLLGNHTGLTSVQLVPPAEAEPDMASEPEPEPVPAISEGEEDE